MTYLNKQIKRSQLDKGKYYLLESSKHGNIVKTLHKRVGVSEVGFTSMEIDCARMKIREIGYGEESISNIKSNPTDWYDLVEGSSKYDVVNFVIKLYADDKTSLQKLITSVKRIIT